jgi:hypothetical protein
MRGERGKKMVSSSLALSVIAICACKVDAKVAANGQSSSPPTIGTEAPLVDADADENDLAANIDQLISQANDSSTPAQLLARLRYQAEKKGFKTVGDMLHALGSKLHYPKDDVCAMPVNVIVVVEEKLKDVGGPEAQALRGIRRQSVGEDSGVLRRTKTGMPSLDLDRGIRTLPTNESCVLCG